jgi:polar amino acid transport system substrate-binding protein
VATKAIRYLLGFTFLVTANLAAMPPLVFAQSVDDIVFMTENYPPFNFEKDGKLQGIATDLMVLILKKLDSKQTLEDFRLLPWARGYRLTLNQKNTCLFATTRTLEREKLFKWVGPITATSIGLIARKERKVKIQSLADLRDYRVGVVRSDIGEQLLVNAGVPLQDLDRVGGTDVTLTSITKLNKGRIDVWSYETNVAKWEIKAKGFRVEEYETVYVLKEGELYFAFNKDTPDSVIEKLQAALDSVVADGEYQKILDRYLN